MAALSAGAVRTSLEGPFCEEDPGSLEKRQIPRPVPEATTGVSSEAEALLQRCRGASLLRPPDATVPAAEADAGGDDRALIVAARNRKQSDSQSAQILAQNNCN